MSRCIRFLAVLPSGTRWKKIRGPLPSGSVIAEASFQCSSGMPWARRNASQLSKPSGGGWSR